MFDHALESLASSHYCQSSLALNREVSGPDY